MADVTYSAEFVVLLDKLKKGVVDTQTTLTKLEKEFKKKGESSGDGFGKGLKKGFSEAGKEATKFGENIVKSLGPIGLILAAVTAAINFFKENLGKAISENEKAGAAFEKVGNIINAVVIPVFEGLASAIAWVADKITWLLDLFSDGAASAAAYAGEMKKAESAVKSLDKEFKEEIKLVEERNKQYKDEKQYIDESLSAHQKYLDALIAEKTANGDISGELQKRIDAELKEVAILKEKAKTGSGSGAKELTLADKLAALKKKMNEELAVAEREAARIADETERENYLRERQNEIYQSTRGELDKLIVQSGATRDNAKKTYEFADDLDNKLKDISNLEKYRLEKAAALAELAEAEHQSKVKLNLGLITEKQLADERNAAQDAFNAKIAEAAAKYDDAEVAAEALNDVIKKGSEQSFDFAKLGQGISQGVGYFQDAAGSVLSVTGRMAQDQIDIIANLLEEQKELIDAQYEETMARLEEERQAALEAAGFVQTVTEEGLAASMEAAMASGDEGVIYKEKRRQEELAINKQYDDLEAAAEKKRLADTKAAEEKAAREIAEIQYKQAMADWTIKLAMAPAQIASAILATIGEAGFFGIPLTPIVAALGALQIAAIAAAVPKKPAFAGGGVVGMPETYRSGYANGGIVEANAPRGVDAVDATLANREMVLNDGQQKNLFNAINEGTLGGGGAGTVIVQLVVDGELWAERMVELINNGATAQIEGRMIAR